MMAVELCERAQATDDRETKLSLLAQAILEMEKTLAVDDPVKLVDFPDEALSVQQQICLDWWWRNRAFTLKQVLGENTE